MSGFHEWLDRWLTKLAVRQHERVLARRRRQAWPLGTPVRFRADARCPCGDACRVHDGTWYTAAYDPECREYDLTREASGRMPVPLEVGRFTSAYQGQLYLEV